MNQKYFFTLLFLFQFTFIFSQDRLYLYQNNKEKGLVDSEGILKTETDFDSIVDLYKDDWTKTKAFLLKKNEKFGLMDYHGKWIFPLKYDDIFCKNDTCKITENRKVGFAAVSGKVIIPNSYDNLDFISDKKIKALKDGNWGFINLNNEWIIKPRFAENTINVHNFSEGLAKICLIGKEKSCGYINEKGEVVIPQIYDEYSGDFHDGLAKTTINGKLNYIDKAGKIAFQSDWNDSSAGDFSNGISVVSKNCQQFDDYGICENYLINTQGKNILPKNCIIVRSFPEDDYTIVRDQKTQKMGVIDNRGKIFVPIEFSDIGNFEGPFNWITVSKYNADQYEMSGFYDRKGNKITECIYSICGTYSDETNPESETFICIERQNGEGRGALNGNGKEVIPPDYENVDFADDVFVVSKLDRKLEIGGIYNSSCGYLNSNGSVLIPLQYKSCSKFDAGIATVLNTEGWKIINKKNETIKILSKDYESVTKFSNGLSHVEKEGKNGLINNKGKLVVPLIYDYIYHYNDVIQVRNEDKYGIIDPAGNLIIPLEYEDTSISTCNGKVFGKKNGQYTWYNLNGEKLNSKIPSAQCFNEDL